MGKTVRGNTILISTVIVEPRFLRRSFFASILESIDYWHVWIFFLKPSF